LFIAEEDSNFGSASRSKGGIGLKSAAPWMAPTGAGGGPGAPKQELEGRRVQISLWGREAAPQGAVISIGLPIAV
jgi:hypothetical protein